MEDKTLIICPGQRELRFGKWELGKEREGGREIEIREGVREGREEEGERKQTLIICPGQRELRFGKWELGKESEGGGRNQMRGGGTYNPNCLSRSKRVNR